MKKNVQRINESQLRAIVAESVKKVLKEEYISYPADGKTPSESTLRAVDALYDIVGDNQDECRDTRELYDYICKWCNRVARYGEGNGVY